MTDTDQRLGNRGNSKDTRRWCKGKVGRPHQTQWVNYFKHKYGSAWPEPTPPWELQLCTVCGRCLKFRGTPLSAVIFTTAKSMSHEMMRYKQGFWNGFNSGGEVVSKNGKPFHLPADIRDCQDVVAVGDVVGYRDIPETWRVTYVDRHLVQMWGPNTVTNSAAPPRPGAGRYCRCSGAGTCSFCTRPERSSKIVLALNSLVS